MQKLGLIETRVHMLCLLTDNFDKGKMLAINEPSYKINGTYSK